MPLTNDAPCSLVLCAAELTTARVDGVVQLLGQQGQSVQKSTWLSPGRAIDLALTAIPEQATVLLAAVEATLEATDLALVPTHNRQKKLLVSDMDSTIIQDETIDLLAAELGLGERVAAITARAMRGEIDFREALRERVGLLRGLTKTALETVPAGASLMPGAGAMVKTMRDHGAHTVLVSGGFDFMTDTIGPAVGFHQARANALEIVDGALSGQLVGDIVDADTKLSVLNAESSRLRLDRSQTLAIGDGANDLKMIQASGMGIAYHAKPIVEQQAAFHIRHTDLRTTLYFQGYSDDEIID